MTRTPSLRWHRWRLRWSRSSPGLRLAVQSVLIAVVAVSAYAVLRGGDVISETAASVLVATVFGTSTVIQLRQSQRRQHTVALIASFQTTESLSEADMWMAKRIASHRPIVAAEASTAELGYVVVMLDYYEYLASLASRGFVDTRLLLVLRAGTMTRCYAVCREYIMDRREDVGSELYRAFELLVSESSVRWPVPSGTPRPRPPVDTPPPEAESSTGGAPPD